MIEEDARIEPGDRADEGRYGETLLWIDKLN